MGIRRDKARGKDADVEDAGALSGALNGAPENDRTVAGADDASEGAAPANDRIAASDSDSIASSIASPSPVPSPSPTPTFSGTGRPARRARRLRWQTGMPASMVALTLFSFTLLVGGVAGYMSTIPGMLYKPAEAPLIPLAFALEANGSASGAGALFAESDSAVVTGPVAARGAAGQDAATAALGLGSSGGGLGVTALAVGSSGVSGSGVDASFSKAIEAAKSGSASSSSSAKSDSTGNGSGAGGAASPGDTTSGSGDSSGDASKPSDSEPTPAPSGPSEEDEAQYHEFLVNHLGRLNSYVSRLNDAITAFDNDAMFGSHELRSRDYGVCAAMDSQALTDFLNLRNFGIPEDSRWYGQKENMQLAYLAIDSYLTVYYDAWVLNLDYDEPASYVDVWMEPVRADLEAGGGTSAKAARLNEVLASISL